ncbi:hypothetical protein VPNG_03024 [Cytospora leucostoma]|uniref:Uncharacterized protein n=1 Tax=Cytospora leucostoma TaxID=1230097 RepID=A0A423XGD9_9PEZI|nr:hypothetical protein VPNG_03024 [Cytospora leucostoma]
MNLTVLNMNKDADDDDPYRRRTEEELADLPEYWWHCWLIDSIKRGDHPAIQRHLARMPESLHEEDPYYWVPFIIAAQQRQVFSVACAHGALETARYLLHEQPALARDGAGSTPILCAAQSLVMCARDEQSEMIGERDGRIRFDAQAARERVHRCEAAVGLLLDRGACACDRRGDGDMVLHLAITRAGPALLQRLLDGAADAFATTTDVSYTVFGFLFESTETSKDLTLLHLAAWCLSHVPAMGFLLSRGADVRIRNKRGRSPLHEAVGGTFGGMLPIPVEESIRAQEAILAVLCGN